MNLADFIGSIDISTVIAVITSLFGIFSGGYAVKQTKEKREANDTIDKINQFFDPNNDKVVEAPPALAKESYTMNEAVLNFLCAGKTDAEKEYIRNIVRTNEAAGISNYMIILPSTEWFRIDYGQVTANGSPGAPITAEDRRGIQHL